MKVSDNSDCCCCSCVDVLIPTSYPLNLYSAPVQVVCDELQEVQSAITEVREHQQGAEQLQEQITQLQAAIDLVNSGQLPAEPSPTDRPDIGSAAMRSPGTDASFQTPYATFQTPYSSHSLRGGGGSSGTGSMEQVFLSPGDGGDGGEGGLSPAVAAALKAAIAARCDRDALQQHAATMEGQLSKCQAEIAGLKVRAERLHSAGLAYASL